MFGAFRINTQFIFDRADHTIHLRHTRPEYHGIFNGWYLILVALIF